VVCRSGRGRGRQPDWRSDRLVGLGGIGFAAAPLVGLKVLEEQLAVQAQGISRKGESPPGPALKPATARRRKPSAVSKKKP